MRSIKTPGVSACVCTFALIAFGILSARADATVVARIGTTDYTDLQTAFNEVGSGQTITLVSDVTNKNITTATYLSFDSGKQATLDLNGKTIYGETSLETTTALLLIKGDLTIDDSSVGQTGRLVVKPLNPAQYSESPAYGNYLAYVGNGTLTIKGGTLENQGNGSACYALEMGSGASVTVDGGTVKALAAVVRMGSASGWSKQFLTVNGGLLDSTWGPGVQYYAPTSGGPAAILITGGEIRAPQYALYVRGTTGGLTINITGGKISTTDAGCPAIYLYNWLPMTFAEQTEMTVSGGEISGDRLLSVFDKYGATHTTFSDGTFSGSIYVYTYDETYKDAKECPWCRRDSYCVRMTGGVFSNFGMVPGSDGWFFWSHQSGVLLYGGTYDNRIATSTDYAGRVAEGYDYLDNHNGTWTVVRGKVIEGVPCAKDDVTDVVEVEKPAETKDEVWTKATNVIASVTTAEASYIVADSELTNAVHLARDEYGDENVTAVFAGVEIRVTPTGVESDVYDDVRTVKMDIVPLLTTWAVVTNETTVTTNTVGEIGRAFECSGKPMMLTFNVSDMVGEPMLIVHQHGSEEYRYTPSTNVTESTFVYKPEAGTVSLLMSKFSEIAIYSGIQVGETAFASVDRDGVCTIIGTGDMWSYDKPGDSKLWAYRDVIKRVVVGDGVTDVGQNSFAYLKRIREVTIGTSVTNVCEDAFFSCLNVTNLVVGAGVQTVGESAFSRCNSLEVIRFGSAAVAKACEDKAFKIVTRITMVGGKPVVDMVPEVAIDGYVRVLKGCENLGDEWETIADAESIPERFHYFKYVYERE